MAFFLKFTAASTIAVVLGLGSAYVALRVEAVRGAAAVASTNPYDRAAYAVRDVLPARQP